MRYKEFKKELSDLFDKQNKEREEYVKKFNIECPPQLEVEVPVGVGTEIITYGIWIEEDGSVFYQGKAEGNYNPFLVSSLKKEIVTALQYYLHDDIIYSDKEEHN